MEENHRALIVILILSSAFFTIARTPVANLIGREDYVRRRNIWLGLTLAAFLTQNYWLYLAIATPLLLFAKRSESNLPALYFFILFALPSATFVVPAGGVVNYLFEISHSRMLALVILLPTLFWHARYAQRVPFGRMFTDKLLAAYLLLLALLHFRDSTLTDTFRQVFYLTLDVFLPYYVMSRFLINLRMFKEAMLSLLLAIMLLALLAVFEFIRSWLLYKPLLDLLDLQGGMTGYLGRDSMLRVSTSVGHPIALGYLMTVGIGLFLFLERQIQRKIYRRMGMALLVAGLLVPLSRGPWVGAVALLIVFVVTGATPVRHLIGLALAGLLAMLLLGALPGGDRLINLLPYIGSTENSTVEYREQLFNNSIIVIQHNLWFGSFDYQNTPEMEALREGGGGIIDIVNSYLEIALQVGVVGLGLFVSFFANVLINIRKAMKSIGDRECDEYLLGRILFAMLLAILVIIATVSSISIIPLIYWSIAGLAVGYIQLVKDQSTNHSPKNTVRA